MCEKLTEGFIWSNSPWPQCRYHGVDKLAVQNVDSASSLLALLLSYYYRDSEHWSWVWTWGTTQSIHVPRPHHAHEHAQCTCSPCYLHMCSVYIRLREGYALQCFTISCTLYQAGIYFIGAHWDRLTVCSTIGFPCKSGSRYSLVTSVVWQEEVQLSVVRPPSFHQFPTMARRLSENILYLLVCWWLCTVIYCVCSKQFFLWCFKASDYKCNACVCNVE